MSIANEYFYFSLFLIFSILWNMFSCKMAILLKLFSKIIKVLEFSMVASFLLCFSSLFKVDFEVFIMKIFLPIWTKISWRSPSKCFTEKKKKTKYELYCFRKYLRNIIFLNWLFLNILLWVVTEYVSKLEIRKNRFP